MRNLIPMLILCVLLASGTPSVADPGGPPPAPNPYAMGAVVNGDFEAGGGSLTGWDTMGGGITVEAFSGDHVALQHADGVEVSYCELYQPIDVPADGEELRFVYCTETNGDTLQLGVLLGSQNWGALPDTQGAWASMTLTIPQDLRGQSEQYLVFWTGAGPSGEWTKFYLDYVAVGPPPATPGDADRDGDVDIEDLSMLASNWGQTAGMTWTQGDFDGDEDVDIEDLSLLASNWGQGSLAASAPSRSGGPTPVPEPSALLLLLVGAGFAARRQLRR